MKNQEATTDEPNFVSEWAYCGELMAATQYGPLSFLDWCKAEGRRLASDGIKTLVRFRQDDKGEVLCALERTEQ